MPSPIWLRWLVAIWFCLPCGCGTVFNLTAPPPPGPPGIGPTICFPFGGVTRSFLLGGLGTASGVALTCEFWEFWEFEEVGQGGLAKAAGITALVHLG